MESILGSRSRRPDIRFCSNGRIDISSRVVRALGIQEGDVLDILHDSDEYYLYVRLKAEETVGRHEARCVKTNPSIKRPHYFRAYSRTLCGAVLQAAGVTDRASLFAGDTVEVRQKKAIIIIPHSNSL
ncbi:MAG: hypothetical protein IKD95_02210 [Bacteroidales bacterium]|nr:hypothetical protein [Bacteroidales bacterium]